MSSNAIIFFEEGTYKPSVIMSFDDKRNNEVIKYKFVVKLKEPLKVTDKCN